MTATGPVRAEQVVTSGTFSLGPRTRSPREEGHVRFAHDSP